MNIEPTNIDYSQYVSDKVDIERLHHYFNSLLACIAGLSHQDHRNRCVALEVFYRHWCLKTNFPTELMLEMLSDESEDVRTWAVCVLGDLAHGSRHETVSRQLALIAIDESRSNKERRMAYYKLLKVRTSLKETAEALLNLGWDAERAFFQARKDDLTFDRVPQMDIVLLRRLIGESPNDAQS